MSTNYGTDISTFPVGSSTQTPDIDPTFTTITDTRAICETILRRITTPHGWLIGSPNDCIDVRQWLNARIGEREIAFLQSTIAAEAKKDERVSVASVDVQHSIATQTLTITIRGLSSAGPFQLVASVSAMTADLLSSN